MQFGHTIIYVKDVPATLTFYKNAFGFATKFLHDNKSYGELLTGQTTLGFASYELAESNGVGFNAKEDLGQIRSEIAFLTSNIEKDFAKALENGATLVKNIEKKPWGELVGYVKDNNGFLVEIHSMLSN